MSSSYDPSVPDLDEVAREIAEGQAITDQLTESQALEQQQIQNFKENTAIPSRSSLDQKASDLVGEAFMRCVNPGSKIKELFRN